LKTFAVTSELLARARLFVTLLQVTSIDDITTETLRDLKFAIADVHLGIEIALTLASTTVMVHTQPAAVS